jgi:anaphase-promoting complex subunit 2
MVDRFESEAVKKYITSRMEGLVEENPGQAVLEEALQHINEIPLLFLETLRIEQVEETKEAAWSRWKRQMTNYVYRTLCELRTNSLFDLVIDYPESLPALQDLKQCLKNARDGYQKLVSVFGSAIRTRLLHPGAATTDIIHHYVSTIRALRHIDQSGTVLDLVSGSLREYLRTRKDAIRCIVTMITEDDSEGEGPGFLAELEAEGEGYDPDADFLGPDADKQALKEIEEDLWEPAPFTISGGQHRRRHRTAAPGDVVSMLVNIYGSKELFVTEYRSMLADRLLAKMDFDCDRELRTLELLKVRFGEQALHPAEVMLRDLADSKRINTNVRNMANTATPLKSHQRDLVPLDSFGVTIVSELFWPQLAQNEEFKLPKQVQGMMKTFGHKYHALKAPRILKWKAGLGAVALTLTVGDKDIEFNVSPLHAAILVKFEEHPEWIPTELAESLDITAESLRRKIVYWINQGVILEVRKSGDSGGLLYRRNEQLERLLGPSGDLGDAGMDVDDSTTPEVDPMSQYEPFVLGMLTNFDALGLDRIHNMLKMFVTDPPYDRTIEQLSGFMGKLSTEDKVVLEGGVYRKK